MQAIQTKYHGPTNHRGSRITAKCAAGSLTFGYDHRLNTEGNHLAAAQALCDKLGWKCGEGLRGELSAGQLPDGSYCHVFTALHSELRGLHWREEGDANVYALLKDNDWFASIRVNGCYLVDHQRELLQSLTGVKFTVG